MPTIALSYNWHVRQLDINNAFLNGDLFEPVFMEQPQGFVDSSRPSHVCFLKKALYDLKQAPHAWFSKLKTFLLSSGFRGYQSDCSIFVRFHSAGIIYVLVYVDDLIVTGSSSSRITSFIQALNKTFSLKDLGDLHYFLGIEITRSFDGLLMCQQKYIKDLLKRSKMADAKPISIMKLEPRIPAVIGSEVSVLEWIAYVVSLISTPELFRTGIEFFIWGREGFTEEEGGEQEEH